MMAPPLPIPPPRAPRGAWLVTFADLIALLLAFFVMLYATQKVERGKWDALVQSLSHRLNPDQIVVLERPRPALNVKRSDPHHAIDLAYLEVVLKGRRSSHPILNKVRLHRLDDRLIIKLPGDLLFAPASAIPSASAGTVIRALVGVLGNVGNRIDVYGHTDPGPVGGTSWSSNWELSLARAVAVAREIRRAGYGHAISSFGYGDSRFGDLASVEPLERRYDLARRVDIVVRRTKR